jgi:hypothetical protein
VENPGWTCAVVTKKIASNSAFAPISTRPSFSPSSTLDQVVPNEDSAANAFGISTKDVNLQCREPTPVTQTRLAKGLSSVAVLRGLISLQLGSKLLYNLFRQQWRCSVMRGDNSAQTARSFQNGLRVCSPC